MKGKIVLPGVYKTRHTDNYKYLFSMMSNEMGFDVEYSNDPIISHSLDVLIVFATPQHNRPGAWVKDLLNLPDRIKIVAYHRDLHEGWTNPEQYHKDVAKLFDRYDMILSPYSNGFLNRYPQYAHKWRFFPDFVAPFDRYFNLEAGDHQKNQCLLSGAAWELSYPHRNYMARYYDPDILVHIDSPVVVNHGFIGDKYAQLLNSYKCCIVDPGHDNCAVQKYFEVPAANSIMLAKPIADLIDLGFVENIHYVPADVITGEDKIRDVLENTEYYTSIREEGRNLVMKNHTVHNRFDEIKKLIEKVL